MQERQTVLLVEDDPDTRESIQFLLQSYGYDVVTAENGRDALGTLRGGFVPGLIVLDLMMPIMDGFQFRQEQLRDRQLADIPVAVCSGHFDTRTHAKHLRAAAYFEKPIDFDKLLDCVNHYCRS